MFRLWKNSEDLETASQNFKHNVQFKDFTIVCSDILRESQIFGEKFGE